MTQPRRSGAAAGQDSAQPGQAMPVTRWHLGAVPAQAGPLSGVVALTEADLAAADAAVGTVLSFADVVAAPAARAPQVHVTVPPYRGKSFLTVLAWLVVERLAQPGAEVTWFLAKRQGPDSARAILQSQGWRLDSERDGRTIRLVGNPPPQAIPPQPRGFTATLGGREHIRLAADYGVFSPGQIDAGTALLLDVALAHEPVPRVADIGVGYGALALGLLLNGVAGSAAGSDVDAVALWLAGDNARAHGARLDLTLTGDPAAVEATPLTVCNVPTHLSAQASARFLAALVDRSRSGTLLIVVHAALEQRYARHLAPAGPLRRFPGPAHVVLGTGR